MYGILVLLVFVVSVFVWRYAAKKFFAKGRSRLFTYFISTSITFFVLVFGLAVIAPLNPVVNQVKAPKIETKVDDTAKNEQNFKEDQKALITYFNKITPVKVYVDLHEQELTVNLDQNNIVQASETAKKCAEATKMFSKELDRGDYKAPTLSDKEENKALKTAIYQLSSGYDFRQAQCSAIYKYLDDRKPSIATEIKEQKALADATIDLAMTSLKKDIASKYRIEVSNGIYMAMK